MIFLVDLIGRQLEWARIGNPRYRGGRIHYLSPDLNIGSYLNGHSIDHVIEALTPSNYMHDISRAFFRAASRLKL